MITIWTIKDKYHKDKIIGQILMTHYIEPPLIFILEKVYDAIQFLSKLYAQQTSRSEKKTRSCSNLVKTLTQKLN